MKNNEANIFLLIASFIIGILISTNIAITKNNGKSKKTVFLNSQQYQEAYNYKNKLRNEILGYMGQYNNYAEKLKKYQNDDKNQIQTKTNISRELEQDKMILGKVQVHGQGIEINITDGFTNDSMDAFEYQMRIVHNTDIIQVINDLNNAGAETLSVNGHRIIDRTEIYCSGPFLRINQVKVAAPFIITAIGNKEVMYNYITSPESYIAIMKNRKINVNVKRYNDLKIPAYDGNYSSKFMKEGK